MIRAAKILGMAALVTISNISFAADLPGDHSEQAAAPGTGPAPNFTPPDEARIPKNDFGAMVRLGKEIFVDTRAHAGKYVGNGLNCSNCHLDSGRHAHSAPLWAAYVSYPAYRKKTQRVDTYEERLQGCFRYSMNGTAPPSGSRELTALVAYSYWLASGAPVGVKLAGAGYPKLPKSATPPDIRHGAKLYAENCSVCHGINGQGTKLRDKYAFPPLWGKDSFNWGAGMHRIDTAAGFIKANMPLGQPNSLNDQDAWDVAAFVVSHERPPDPRFTTSLAVTKKKYHDEMCYYGDRVNGHVVGAGLAPPAKNPVNAHNSR